MTVISVDEAKEDLEKLIKQVMNDAEPAILRTSDGEEVVMLSREEFDSWTETVYLLASPANAAHLRRSIKQANSGKVEERDLIEA
jgi:antitoxin YefM